MEFNFLIIYTFPWPGNLYRHLMVRLELRLGGFAGQTGLTSAPVPYPNILKIFLQLSSVFQIRLSPDMIKRVAFLFHYSFIDS